MVFDYEQKHVNVLKCKGFSVVPRKNHIAAIIGKSMVVYGG
jgi:hypothetical protein